MLELVAEFAMQILGTVDSRLVISGFLQAASHLWPRDVPNVYVDCCEPPIQIRVSPIAAGVTSVGFPHGVFGAATGV